MGSDHVSLGSWARIMGSDLVSLGTARISVDVQSSDVCCHLASSDDLTALTWMLSETGSLSGSMLLRARFEPMRGHGHWPCEPVRAVDATHTRCSDLDVVPNGVAQRL